jgi:hypothetical protein
MRTVKRVTMTTKKYTVVLAGWDPVHPVIYMNTNSRTKAESLFRQLRQVELNEALQAGGYGGEWQLRLWEHTPGSKVCCRTASEPEYGSEPFVYCIHFAGSKVLREFSYMDILTIQDCDGCFVQSVGDWKPICGFLRYVPAGDGQEHSVWRIQPAWDGDTPILTRNLGSTPIITRDGIEDKRGILQYEWAGHEEERCASGCPLHVLADGIHKCEPLRALTGIAPGQHECILRAEVAEGLLQARTSQLQQYEQRSTTQLDLQRRAVDRLAALAGYVDYSGPDRRSLLSAFREGGRQTGRLVSLLAAQSVHLIGWLEPDTCVVDYDGDWFELYDEGQVLRIWQINTDYRGELLTGAIDELNVETLAKQIACVLRGGDPASAEQVLGERLQRGKPLPAELLGSEDRCAR